MYRQRDTLVTQTQLDCNLRLGISGTPHRLTSPDVKHKTTLTTADDEYMLKLIATNKRDDIRSNK